MDSIIVRRASEDDLDFITQCLLDMMIEVMQYGGHAVNDEPAAWDALRKRAVSGFAGDRHAFMCAVDPETDSCVGLTEISVRDLPDFLEPKRSLHIHTFYVMPDHRRQGVGKALYNAAIYWGRNRNCTEVELDALENNPALELYESLGFRRFQSEYRKPI